MLTTLPHTPHWERKVPWVSFGGGGWGEDFYSHTHVIKSMMGKLVLFL